VEDEPAALELVAEVLRESGYQVLVASNGDEAVSVAVRARAPIHLLLTDVVLPRLSGQIVAERVRTTHPRVKVLFMSGYTDDAISHHGVLQPGVALLQKPFTPDELSRRVGEILDEG
jgi:DNA-binding response OmpR family regulator